MGIMRKCYRIDEAEYKRGLKEGAEMLINANMRPYAINAEVYEIVHPITQEKEHWLAYDFNELRYSRAMSQLEDAHLNGYTVP